MDANTLVSKITRDVAVELSDEYDLNFERKGFFDRAWPATKLRNAKGSLMMRSGNLRRSIKYNIRANMITWSSSLPYASIHNDGGEITVTAKMRKYFWAMYYKAAGGLTYRQDGEQRNNQRNQRLNAEASQWKALALMKVGQKIKVEKRQFIGDHIRVKEIIQNVLDINMQDVDRYLQSRLRR